MTRAQGAQRQALRSGGLVATHHVVGSVITAVSALLLSKALGPGEFALYVFCNSLAGVLRVVSRLGVNECLLTQREEPEALDYQVALTTMLLASVLTACAASAALPLLVPVIRMPRVLWPAIATSALLPLHVLPLPALTRLERALTYRPVVVIDVLGQVVGQVIGIALAFLGWGVWGPLMGGAVRGFVQGVLPWLAVGLRPVCRWEGSRAIRMVKYGAGYLVTTTVAYGRNVVLLGVVGHTVGQEAVGYVGLTLRAIGLVAPFRAAVSRVLLPALAPTAHVPHLLRAALNSAVETELLLSAPVTLCAVTVYGPAVRLLLGPAWQPTIVLFGWIAAGSLLAAVHGASLSALLVRGFFGDAIVAICARYVALVAAVVVLGRWGGIEGCAAATVVVWPAYWVQEWCSRRRLGTPWSRNGVSWAVAGAAACLAGRLGGWMLLLPAIILVATRDSIRARAAAIVASLARRQSTPVTAGERR